MNIKHPISILTLTLTPFFIATGCSSTGGQHPASVAINPTTPSTSTNLHTSPINKTTIDETLVQKINTPDNTSLAIVDDAAKATQKNEQQTATSTSNNIDSATEELEMLGILESETPPETTASNDPRPAKHVFHFGFNKAELSDEEKAIIQGHGQFLASHPSQSIIVHGHADSQGDQNYNKFLSEKRAQHVAALLKKEGATKDQIEIFSWSSASPADALTNYKVNRRVELHYGQENSGQESGGQENDGQGYFAQKTQ